MKKMNIILLSLVVLSSAIFGNSSNEAGQKLSVIEGAGQKLSVSVGCLTTSGDISDRYESAMSIDFLINCNKSCSVFGKELNLGLGIGFMPTFNDEDDSSIQALNLGSVGLHVMPNFNLPVSFDFAAGLSKAPGNMTDPKVGMMGFISMDLFYKLPMCKNISLGFQYKQFVDPEDGELNFSKLGAYGLALKIDG